MNKINFPQERDSDLDVSVDGTDEGGVTVVALDDAVIVFVVVAVVVVVDVVGVIDSTLIDAVDTTVALIGFLSVIEGFVAIAVDANSVPVWSDTARSSLVSVLTPSDSELVTLASFPRSAGFPLFALLRRLSPLSFSNFSLFITPSSSSSSASSSNSSSAFVKSSFVFSTPFRASCSEEGKTTGGSSLHRRPAEGEKEKSRTSSFSDK